MANKGRGGDHHPSNHGRGHGVSWRTPVTTTFSVHISTSKSTIPIDGKHQAPLRFKRKQFPPM